MLTPRRASRYCSYLLRCVQQRGQNPPQWHFSLEDPRTGERRGFASLDALIAVLRYEFSDDEHQELDGTAGSLTAPAAGEE